MWTIIVRDPQGQEIARKELTAGALVLGRGKDCGVVLPSGSVSRKHARLELRGDKLFFFDEGSANGSLVDGRRVVAPAEVNARSAIEITPFKIALEGGAAADDLDKTVMMRAPPAQQAPTAPSRPPPRPAAPAAAPAMALPTAADLRPMAPPSPPRPAAAAAPETAFTIRFPEPAQPHGPARAPNNAQADADAGTELERHIQGIRNYREQADTNTSTRLIHVDQGWQALVNSMQVLKARLANNPRLQGFGISRDGKEVTIRLSEPREKRGFRYFVLARHHPAGKFPGLDVVWVCETGRDDMNFRDPKDAQTELLQRIASTLA